MESKILNNISKENSSNLDLKRAKSQCFQTNVLRRPQSFLELKGKVISEGVMNTKPKTVLKLIHETNEINDDELLKETTTTSKEVPNEKVEEKTNDPEISAKNEVLEETSCPYCNKIYTIFEIWDHVTLCEEQHSKVPETKTEVKIEMIKSEDDLITQCKYCSDWFGTLDMEEHLIFCENKHEVEKIEAEFEKEKEREKELEREKEIEREKEKEKEAIKTELDGKEVVLGEDDGLKKCRVCNDYFGLLDFEDHTKKCKKVEYKPMFSRGFSSVSCPVCNVMLDLDELSEHVCLDSNKEIKEGEDNNVPKEEPLIKKCKFCREEFATGDLLEHEIKCGEDMKIRIDSEKKIINENRLKLMEEKLVNEMQLNAVIYVQDVSETKSIEARPLLLERFKKVLGYGEYELETTLQWIRSHAPIIVHFHPQRVMQFFVKDTHYRNQFETGTSSGTLSRPTRIGWEDKIFNHIYHDSSDFDRVKYGVLNIVNDPNGVQCCSMYGDSYLVLNNDTIRLRTTFASGDTSGNVELATCEHYCHVLNTFSDKELKDVVSVATRKRFCVSSKNICVYKEIQIHGELRFDRDVSAMILNTTHFSNPEVAKQAEEFAKNNNFNLVWMDH